MNDKNFIIIKNLFASAGKNLLNSNNTKSFPDAVFKPLLTIKTKLLPLKKKPASVCLSEEDLSAIKRAENEGMIPPDKH